MCKDSKNYGIIAILARRIIIINEVPTQKQTNL